MTQYNILIVCSGNAKKFSFEKNQTFIYDQVKAVQKGYEDFQFHLFFIRGKGLSGYLENLPGLIKSIIEKNIHLIHAHNGYSGLLSTLQRRVPVITTFHGSDLNNKKTRVISNLVHLLSSKTIVVSQKLFEKLLFRKKKATIIPCGIDFNIFHPIDRSLARKRMNLDQNKKYILFSSSFDNPVKNFPVAEKALEMSGISAEFLELKGYSRKEVNLLLNAANLALLTSFSEGSPQFIKEAMACNTPVVSTDVGDVKELINTTNGCYIAKSEPEDLAKKIKNAIKYNHTEGRKNIQPLSNKIIAAKIADLYKTLLQ
jgi:glycosyltransferase involved in cell wall biosynthesis